MNLLNKLFFKQETSFPVKAETKTVYLPMTGMVIPLPDIADGVFSEGLLGPGCGIVPTGEKVYAFVDGTIVTIAPTKHAIGILSEDGLEVLLHIGMDTVEMNGAPFCIEAKVGQKVKCGDLLLSFDSKQIKKAGFTTTSALVITNGNQYQEIEILAQGTANKLSPCIKVK